MWFWWLILICDMTIPVVMLLAGRMMRKHCPGEINGVIGYRTKRSMKNADTWSFAHEYCGGLWQRLGLIMIVPTVLIHLPFRHCGENAIGIVGIIVAAVQCIAMLASVFLTEHALKKTFDADGARRDRA